ncbi:hypothetical protein EJ08DRAFT_701920 [Tothia fuscella]|uniref:NET domain-containing protein n=1 Tax=Tothia fuscella TaxID=1048955 RepID=A0A9P4NHA5_9PEZI|nr:hypothetical protein EJ08DRAFT_701920 [Tothia fuscella]
MAAHNASYSNAGYNTPTQTTIYHTPTRASAATHCTGAFQQDHASDTSSRVLNSRIAEVGPTTPPSSTSSPPAPKSAENMSMSARIAAEVTSQFAVAQEDILKLMSITNTGIRGLKKVTVGLAGQVKTANTDIAALWGENANLRAKNVEAKGEITELKGENGELRKRVGTLEEELEQFRVLVLDLVGWREKAEKELEKLGERFRRQDDTLTLHDKDLKVLLWRGDVTSGPPPSVHERVENVVKVVIEERNKTPVDEVLHVAKASQQALENPAAAEVIETGRAHDTTPDAVVTMIPQNEQIEQTPVFETIQNSDAALPVEDALYSTTITTPAPRRKAVIIDLGGSITDSDDEFTASKPQKIPHTERLITPNTSAPHQELNAPAVPITPEQYPKPASPATANNAAHQVEQSYPNHQTLSNEISPSSILSHIRVAKRSGKGVAHIIKTKPKNPASHPISDEAFLRNDDHPLLSVNKRKPAHVAISPSEPAPKRMRSNAADVGSLAQRLNQQNRLTEAIPTPKRSKDDREKRDEIARGIRTLNRNQLNQAASFLKTAIPKIKNGNGQASELLVDVENLDEDVIDRLYYLIKFGAPAYGVRPAGTARPTSKKTAPSRPASKGKEGGLSRVDSDRITLGRASKESSELLQAFGVRKEKMRGVVS